MSTVDFEYWTFPGLVFDAAGIVQGQAVRFSGTTSPYSYPARIVNADTDNNATFRTNYVGIAMNSGALNSTITIRPWSTGTMPARCLSTSASPAGTMWKYDATQKAFIPDVTDAATAVNLNPIPANAAPQIVELLGLKGGPK